MCSRAPRVRGSGVRLSDQHRDGGSPVCQVINIFLPALYLLLSGEGRAVGGGGQGGLASASLLSSSDFSCNSPWADTLLLLLLLCVTRNYSAGFRIQRLSSATQTNARSHT